MTVTRNILKALALKRKSTVKVLRKLAASPPAPAPLKFFDESKWNNCYPTILPVLGKTTYYFWPHGDPEPTFGFDREAIVKQAKKRSKQDKSYIQVDYNKLVKNGCTSGFIVQISSGQIISVVRES